MGPNYWLGAWALVTTLTVSSGQTDEDEKRPYKFAFSIEGYQHRSEQKDERGIIMGEYGFVTGDGVYHVTVYATDENGDFKIISMKNYYVGLPGEGTTAAPTRAPTTIARTPPVPVTQATPSTTVSPIIQHLQGLMGCSGCIIPDKGNGKKSPTPGTTSSDEGEGIIDIRFDDEERPPASSPGYEDATEGVITNRPSGGDRLSGGFGVQSTGGTRYPSTGETENPTAGPTFGTLPTGGFPNVGSGTPQGGSGAVSTFSPGELPGTTNIPGTNIPNQVSNGFIPSNGPQRPGSPGQQTPSGVGGPSSGNRFGETQSSQEDGPSGGQAGDDADLVFPKQDQSARPVTPSLEGQIPPGTSETDLDALLYKFNYTLKYHGHHESGYRNGDKEGAYFFNGRDGKGRNVEYIANEFGYQPNITLVDLGLESPDTPKEENEEPNELKGYEFKWFYQR